MDSRWFTEPVTYTKKDMISKSQRKIIKPSDVGLKPHIMTNRLCDIYTSCRFLSKVVFDERNGTSIITQSYQSFKLIIKDLIGPGKQLQGITILVRKPAMFNVSMGIDSIT